MQNKVKAKREELGITQEELATRANVTRQTINAIETGRATNILMSTMVAVARALDSKVDEIFL